MSCTQAANPRDEHEWEEWRRAGVSDDKVLIPGVITSRPDARFFSSVACPQQLSSD
jgi:hypothetical protein